MRYGDFLPVYDDVSGIGCGIGDCGGTNRR